MPGNEPKDTSVVQIATGWTGRVHKGVKLVVTRRGTPV